MKLATFLWVAPLVLVLSCKSTDNAENEEFIESEDSIAAAAFDAGKLPFLVHPNAKKATLGDGQLFKFSVPIGMKEPKAKQPEFFDRLLLKTDATGNPSAVAILSYPGFFQGQLAPEPDISVDVLTFDASGDVANQDSFDSGKEAAETLKAVFASGIGVSESGFSGLKDTKTIKTDDAFKTVKVDRIKESFFALDDFPEIVFDDKHALPEQLGLRSDEYGIFERLVAQQILDEGADMVFGGLRMRRMTIDQLLKHLQDEELKKKVSETYKDEFSENAPEITEFDSSMDSEIKDEMMNLLKAINE